MTDEEGVEKQGPVVRVVRWLDSRLGLSYPLLRPVPRFSINPFYWLGALTVVAFTIQAVTGMILLVWYVPDPASAYQSTAFIFSSVTDGRFLETVHLYGAYSMILLAVMHMMRNYFVSSFKKPREAMWIVGMLMGFVTLGFGFTGYVLPWTQISVDATNVGINLLNPLPPSIVSFAKNLLGVTSGYSTELVRFEAIHIVLLPAALLLLLFGKMYMLEAHGIAPPAGELTPRQQRLIPLFPNVTIYLLELSALFTAALLVISAAFPYTLPAQFSLTPPANTPPPQPDWYFLWMYQILKLDVFEGTVGLSLGLTVITLIFAALFVLPFIDRGEEKRIAKRPLYITLGAIFVAELAVLIYWGSVTPGQTIPNYEAVLVLGGTALGVALIFAGIYKVMFSKLTGSLTPDAAAQSRSMTMRRAQLWTGSLFTLLLVAGSLAISGSISAFATMVTSGITNGELLALAGYLSGLGLVLFGTIYLLYRLDLATDSIKSRVKVLEVGWPNDQ